MSNNYNRIILILIFGIFGVFHKSYSQNRSRGFYYNENLCSYIFIEKDTVYLYNNNSTGNSKNLFKLRLLNSRSLVGIPIEDTVRTQVSAIRLMENDSNKVYFIIKDIGGFSFTDTMSCVLSYYDSDNNWISEQLYISQDNGQYCFDFSNYPFDTAKIKIDWLFEKIFLMDSIDNPIVTLKKGKGMFFNIVIAPTIKYPRISKKIKVEMDEKTILLRNANQISKKYPDRKIYFYKVEDIHVDDIFLGIVDLLRDIN